MIEATIRFLSHMELIYTCISKLVVFLTKNHPDKVVEPLKYYADPNDYNYYNIFCLATLFENVSVTTVSDASMSVRFHVQW